MQKSHTILLKEMTMILCDLKNSIFSKINFAISHFGPYNFCLKHFFV